jgi:cytidyltransferase-like protein
MTKSIVVSGGFDDLRVRDLRFLEEASKLGELTVLLWPDEALERAANRPPKFPLAERFYVLSAVRYVSHVVPVNALTETDTLPRLDELRPDAWVDLESNANAARSDFCRQYNLEYCVVPASAMFGFLAPPPMPSTPGRKKVVATGCYDWLHSGHVRFCEEVSAYGDLYVIVGHDANIHLLKGEGHPLLPQEERRYAVGSVKYVKEALISSGDGWLDADPEIQRLKPDIYAVNEDGDKGGKREYCEKLGIEYLVLERKPALGLRPRSSTDLRGF